MYAIYLIQHDSIIQMTLAFVEAKSILDQLSLEFDTQVSIQVNPLMSASDFSCSVKFWENRVNRRIGNNTSENRNVEKGHFAHVL